MTMSSQQSHVVLTKLSAGTSYIISIMATQGRTQSDTLTSIITTGTLKTFQGCAVGCATASVYSESVGEVLV